jgi:PAS domain S-box-containing protein
MLEQLEAKSSGILAVSSDALISIDRDRRITMFNLGAEKIFGYAKAEVLGSPFDRLLPERLRAWCRREIEAFAAAQIVAGRLGDRAAALVGLRKSGAEFPADAAISKLEVAGKRILTVAIRDVTDQRRLENELRSALEARDEVLAIVAHDLRNPLSAIVMAASMMKAPERERRDRRTAEIISRAANRMSHLIQDLLDVAQVEAGALRVQRTRVSASDLVLEAVDAQRSLAGSAALALELEWHGVLPEVCGDRNRLLQVFENLIGNAIKFTPPGGRITVSAAVGEGEVLFSVSDTGSGIAPESVAHVFDRFWRPTRDASRRGAGLGLRIARGIVEAHGGRIWVESTVGRGTTFYFAIPVTRPADEHRAVGPE